MHRGPDDQRQLDRLLELSRQSGVPLAAAGDVHYHVPQRQALCDVLTAIRHGCTVATAGGAAVCQCPAASAIAGGHGRAFSRAPEALRRTLEIAERCTFSLDELRYEYPEELAPPGQTPAEYLARLAWAGAARALAAGRSRAGAAAVEHELRLIEELHYEAYFLTVWDLVRFARRRGILCQGRGSAANSAVCYCLGITAVDPERMDVLFERFVSRERNEAPDIDVDFEHERREEVLQYLYRKYGREPGRHDRRGDHLPPPLGGPRRGQGPGAAAGTSRRRLDEEAGPRWTRDQAARRMARGRKARRRERCPAALALAPYALVALSSS